MGLNVFSDEAAEAIAEVVGNIRAHPLVKRLPGPHAGPPPAVPEVHIVRVTSATLCCYGYPGLLQLVDPVFTSPPVFDDGGFVWVVDPNGAALAAQRYVARRTSVAPDGNPVFETPAGLPAAPAVPPPPPTTTTPIPCTGTCYWSWSAVTRSWTLSTSNCAQGTTTSSTSTTPNYTTTTAVPTTTTTPCPAGCPTTTTAAAPANPSCSCLPPSYCGSASCEHTTTFCAHGGANAPAPCCPTTTSTSTTSSTTTTGGGTTTTTTTTSSTTTTIGPGCGTCQFRYEPQLGGWIKIADGCNAANCSCPPATGTGTSCQLLTVPCVAPLPTTTTPAVCQGNCQWLWDPDKVSWGLQVNNCRGINLPCNCEPPSVAGDDCTTVAFTPCFAGATTTTTAGGTTSSTTTTGGGTTSTSTSTTTTTSCQPTTTPQPLGCTGNCLFTWNTALAAWVATSNPCAASCGCPYPPLGAGSSCDSAMTPCAGTTTSTTTSSTTTTCAGSCTWVYNNGWTMLTNGCTTPCSCLTPGGIGFPGQPIQTGCGSTTTTTACPTTTTAAPTCGQCAVVVCAPGTSPTLGACQPAGVLWNACTGTCVCSWSQPCLINNLPTASYQTMIVNCSNPATTTTSAPSCGQCTMRWNGSTWIQQSVSCTGGCHCSPPLGAGSFVGQQVVTNCQLGSF